MPLAGAGPHPPAGRRLTVAASGLMPGGRAARDEDGIHEGCVATFNKRKESDGSGRAGAVSCNHPEQLVDELNLSPTIRTAHPPRLPLPDHVHGLQRCHLPVPPSLPGVSWAQFPRFGGVGSEEAPTKGLASVRRSNGTCRFPAYRFHKGAWGREMEGISAIRRTRPYSP